MSLKICKECGAQISTNAKECPKCGDPQPQRTSPFAMLVLLLGLLSMVIWYFSTDSMAKFKQEVEPSQIAKRFVSLDYKVRLTSLSTFEADFTITNKSQYTVKDIKVTCTHFAKSGTKIDSNTRTIYDVIPALTSKKISHFDMGFVKSQAEKTACIISDLIV